ncbi:hypothetical protein L208DRAFT_1388835 [Tricholoma matsutake]|nr:hypothetical protein L208DRAFT_1388835 [Tricholoma matsutake 945]
MPSTQDPSPCLLTLRITPTFSNNRSLYSDAISDVKFNNCPFRRITTTNTKVTIIISSPSTGPVTSATPLSTDGASTTVTLNVNSSTPGTLPSLAVTTNTSTLVLSSWKASSIPSATSVSSATNISSATIISSATWRTTTTESQGSLPGAAITTDSTTAPFTFTSATQAQTSHPPHHPPVGAIAGAVITVLNIIARCVFLVRGLRRRRRKQPDVEPHPITRDNCESTDFSDSPFPYNCNTVLIKSKQILESTGGNQPVILWQQQWYLHPTSNIPASPRAPSLPRIESYLMTISKPSKIGH